MSSAAWELVERQHGVVTRPQLLALGFSKKAIQHRLRSGRLHPTWPGVYAVGRRELSEHGRWLAAVVSCGPAAVLSHESAAALWGIGRTPVGRPEVSVPLHIRRRPRGIVVHRRAPLGPEDVARRCGIPVTSPVCTLVDLAARLDRRRLEAAVAAADKLDLVDPERLRSALAELVHRPGTRPLRRLLDAPTFTITDSELERRFLPIARRAALPPPAAGVRLNGFKVDFHWPRLGLVVETDGLRYHRTPSQQARDRLRDQAHTAAGLTTLRFTRAQVRFEPDHVEATLRAVARRLADRARRKSPGT